MRSVTVADSDILALGGSLPRRGFLQVWRITAQGDLIDRAKVTEVGVSGADVSVELEETDETTGYTFVVRGAVELAGEWNVALPAGAPVGLAALVDEHAIDPTTLLPLDPVPPTLTELIDARITEVGVPEEQIAEAVADYLEDNPPNAGVTHSQMVASASWVIPHSFGRLPNVAVYIDGAEVDADVTSTSTNVTVTFASPQTGVAVLN